MTYGHDVSKLQSLDLLKAFSPGFFQTLFGFPRLAFKLTAFWMERRRQRRALAWLDDRMLKDIGVSRDDAAQEISKSLWL